MWAYKQEIMRYMGEYGTPVFIVKGAGCIENADRDEYIFCSDFLLIQYR